MMAAQTKKSPRGNGGSSVEKTAAQNSHSESTDRYTDSQDESISVGRGHWFTMVMDVVLEDERLSKTGLLCYLALCRYANVNSRDCDPSLSGIAKLARLSRNSVLQGIEELERLSYIRRTRRTEPGRKERARNVYFLTDQPGAVTAPPPRIGSPTAPPWFNDCTTGGATTEPKLEGKKEIGGAPTDVKDRLREIYGRRYSGYLGLTDADAKRSTQLATKHGAETYLSAFAEYISDNAKFLREKGHPIASFTSSSGTTFRAPPAE